MSRPDFPCYRRAWATDPTRYIWIGDRTDKGTVTQLRLTGDGWRICVASGDGITGALPGDPVVYDPGQLIYVGPALTHIELDVDADQVLDDLHALAAIAAIGLDKPAAFDRIYDLLTNAIQEARQ